MSPNIGGSHGTFVVAQAAALGLFANVAMAGLHRRSSGSRARISRLVEEYCACIRSYVTKDGHLFLSLMADGGIYEFEPVTKTKP
jgi:hypothetical protein